MNSTMGYSGFQLSDFQNEFVERFLSSQVAYHLLVAPVGSGKSLISSVIIHKMVNAGAQRILILIPSPSLVDMYKKVLSEIDLDINIVSLSRKIIREVETLNQKDSFWARSVFIAPLTIAINEELKENIFSFQWDLVIIDEVQHFNIGSKPADFVKKLIEKRIAKKVLALSFESPSVVSRLNKKSLLGSKLFDNFQVTNWNRKYKLSDSISRKVILTQITYNRTSEEAEFTKKYLQIAKLISETRLQNSIRTQTVSSSLYAADESLRRLRNRLANNDPSDLLDIAASEKTLSGNEDFLFTENTNKVRRKLSKKETSALLDDLSILLKYLDEIKVDSKFDALLKVVKGIQVTKQNTWISASFQSTISYLHSSLSEINQNTYQIHGFTPMRQVYETIQNYKDNGGILITSTNLLKGVEIPLDNLILYDIPESESLIYTTFSRFSNPSIQKTNMPVKVFVFDDLANVIKPEKIRFQRLQRYLQEFFQEEL